MSMDNVDRLGLTTGLSIKSYGVRIGIRSNDAQCLKRACEYLPHDWEPSTAAIVDRVYSIIIRGEGKRPNGRRLNLLYGNDLQIARSSNAEDLLSSLESDLRLFVAETAHRRVFVHAGVVGWKGRAIVIPGRSFSGKSTLVAELVKAGATYYSDEYAVFDSKGRVHPFLKPLEIRDQGDTRQSKVHVTDLGGQSGRKPLPVSLVVVARFREDAIWRPRKLSAGKGVLELLANTVSARRNPEQAFATLQQVAASAQLLKGTRGEATEIIQTLLAKAELN